VVVDFCPTPASLVDPHRRSASLDAKQRVFGPPRTPRFALMDRKLAVPGLTKRKSRSQSVSGVTYESNRSGFEPRNCGGSHVRADFRSNLGRDSRCCGPKICSPRVREALSTSPREPSAPRTPSNEPGLGGFRHSDQNSLSIEFFVYLPDGVGLQCSAQRSTCTRSFR